MSNILSNVSIDKIIELLIAILGIGGLAFYFSVKINKNKDSNKVGELHQKIEKGNNNYQSGRDINVNK